MKMIPIGAKRERGLIRKTYLLPKIKCHPEVEAIGTHFLGIRRRIIVIRRAHLLLKERELVSPFQSTWTC